jgi:hypothetical protein
LQRSRAPRAWERNPKYTTGPVPTWSETNTWGGIGARRPASAMPRIRHPEKGKQLAGGENPDTSAQEVAESNAPGQTVFDQRFAQGLDPITGVEPLQEVTGGAMDTGLSGAGGPESTAEVVAGEGVSGKSKTPTSQKRKGNDDGRTSKEALKKGKKGAKGKEAEGGATTTEEVNAVRFF